RAEAIDPNFALAHVGEADAYTLLAGSKPPASDWYPLAKAAAARALQLDPTLGEANASLAFANFAFDRDYPAAEGGFQRALFYNPGYATARHWRGMYLSAMGRSDEAIAELKKAKQLDPLSASIRDSSGTVLYMARRYDEAIAEFRATVDLDPTNPSPYSKLAYTYEQKGMIKEAIAEAERGMRVAPHRVLTAELARLAALDGRRADALKGAADLIAAGIAPNYTATIYAALGDRDRTFDFLDRAEREGTPYLLWIKVDPTYDSLRDDPRFQRLLRAYPHTP